MKIVITILLIISIISLAQGIQKNKEIEKIDLQQIFSIIKNELNSEAKSKIGGDLKWELGNLFELNLKKEDVEIVPFNKYKNNKEIQEMMKKYNIKIKKASPETKAKLIDLINKANIKRIRKTNKRYIYLYYKGDKIYISGLLLLKSDINKIDMKKRIKEIKLLQDEGVIIRNDSFKKYNEFSVFIPIDKFVRVMNLDLIKKFKSDRTLNPHLDASIPEIGANEIWNKGLKGEGTIIGIIDDGIDLGHNDFQIAAGNTRILYLWDQTTTGVPPEGYSYGNECNKSQIDAGECSQQPECNIGHGTHTAGIAAGNGSLSSGTYTGVSPNADIIYVKIESEAATSKVWDAIQYLINKANSLGKPIAISLSYGSQSGPHDGFADLDWLIDQSLNENSSGISLAISAGNDGNTNLHTDALVCPKGAGSFDYSTISSVGFPWYTSQYNFQYAPDLVYEFYYPANKNINVRVGIPALLDDTPPLNCDNFYSLNWYTLYFRFTPEIDNIFTEDSKPNSYGIIYGLQRGYLGGLWDFCDTPVGDILKANEKYARFIIYRETDCSQLNNSHAGISRCGAAYSPGGCDYHLDNELPPGVDAIYILITPATDNDIYPREGTPPLGCGSNNKALTCANDLWHCAINQTGEYPCPLGDIPLTIDIQFDEKEPTAADPYGDGGCYNNCNSYISNCNGLPEINSPQTELEGWINNSTRGWFITWKDADGIPLPELCNDPVYGSIMQGDSRQCIAEPASAYSAIAVAAYTTKLDGCDNTDDPVGNRPEWSSTGPLRDGSPASSWQKPEISAPGESIASAKPLCVSANCPVLSNYQLMSGTSMSAAHVAGSASLLLQCCPQLTLGIIKNLLDSNALDAGNPGFDYEWGWGKLRTYSAYSDLLPQFNGIRKALPISPTQIELKWESAIVDECPISAKYDIFRIQGGCPFTPSLNNRIASDVQSTNYIDNDLLPLTKYSYIVRAVIGDKCSEENNVCLTAITPSGPPGEVPQKSGSGVPLLISKSGTNLIISWGAPLGSCGPINYGIYRGIIGDYYSHTLIDCYDDLHDRIEVIPSDTGNYYFLVVARTSTKEGSYGKNSSGIERPKGIETCVPVQDLSPC